MAGFRGKVDGIFTATCFPGRFFFLVTQVNIEGFHPRFVALFFFWGSGGSRADRLGPEMANRYKWKGMGKNKRPKITG